MRKDILIIGGGLAGSQTAFFALKNGLTFDLIHDSSSHCASKIATGLINPIVLRHITLSWNAATVIPLALGHYKALSNSLNTAIFEDKPIYRPLYDEGEVNTWLSKEKEDRFKNYLSHIKEIDAPHIKTPQLWGQITSCGRVNTSILLKSLHEQFSSADSLIDTRFNYEDLHLSTSEVTYNNTTYSKVVFAEGYNNINNPYFNDLPLNQTKGEIHVYEKPSATDKLISRGVFFVPINEHELEVGSTFNWNEKDWEPTQAGKQELYEKMSKTVQSPLKHLRAKAGLRPTSKDRKPVVGQHKDHPMLYIHNGLGTKGVSLSPYTSKALIEHFTQGTPIPNEIDVKRFYK